VNQGEDDGKASKVLLKVTNLPTVQKVKNNLVSYENFPRLKYVLFPAYNETDPSLKPHKLLTADGITWDLDFAFTPTISPEQKTQVIETLQWWANFGGLGFRSRKGLGAFYVSECQDFPKICESLSSDDVAKANCQLVQKNIAPNAIAALETAIQKLSDFRQKAGVGRNEPSEEAKKHKKPAGRSCFPEPDALRRIQRNLGYDRRHEPVHPAGNIFPRGAFGLPILFHSHQEKAVNATLEPSFGERLASPLILRPVFAGIKDDKPLFKASALVLPYQYILDMKVILKGNETEYPIWQKDRAQDIRPIAENGGGDPLQAFLTYFAK
jgi:CRISPR-associated protein Cmr1